MRYLQTAKYKKHSGTWYANNFKAAVGRPDAITFDASPTTFSNIELAPGWIHKWLPQARRHSHNHLPPPQPTITMAQNLNLNPNSNPNPNPLTPGQAPDHAARPRAANLLTLAHG